MCATIELPAIETEEVAKVFREYGLSEPDMDPVVKAIPGNQGAWVDFMMRFELGLEEPRPKRARISAFTIAMSYIVGGMIPKIEACMSALRHGVKKTHVISGLQSHTLLLELFTNQGVGTEIKN